MQEIEKVQRNNVIKRIHRLSCFKKAFRIFSPYIYRFSLSFSESKIIIGKQNSRYTKRIKIHSLTCQRKITFRNLNKAI